MWSPYCSAHALCLQSQRGWKYRFWGCLGIFFWGSCSSCDSWLAEIRLRCAILLHWSYLAKTTWSTSHPMAGYHWAGYHSARRCLIYPSYSGSTSDLSGRPPLFHMLHYWWQENTAQIRSCAKRAHLVYISSGLKHSDTMWRIKVNVLIAPVPKRHDRRQIKH